MSILRGVNPENGRLSFQKILRSGPPLSDRATALRLMNHFLKEGIRETFSDINPIEDFTGNLVLEFLDHFLDETTYSTEECRDRDATYARPPESPSSSYHQGRRRDQGSQGAGHFHGGFPLYDERGTFHYQRCRASHREPTGFALRVSILLRTSSSTQKRTFACTVIP